MGEHYILENDKIVPVDLMTWARWFEGADRTIATDELASGVRVSTVFLGLDHGYGGGPPILFETMIFGGDQDEYQDRYATKAAALAGHAKAVALARGES